LRHWPDDATNSRYLHSGESLTKMLEEIGFKKKVEMNVTFPDILRGHDARMLNFTAFK